MQSFDIKFNLTKFHEITLSVEEWFRDASIPPCPILSTATGINTGDSPSSVARRPKDDY